MLDETARRVRTADSPPEPLPILGQLEIIQCPDADQVGRTLLIRREETSIGRATSNAIAFQDPDMSGYHARILARGGELLLIDALSTNGTWVNGIRVGHHRLRAGDTFLLGATVFKTVDT